MEVSSDGPNSPSISNKSLNIVTKPEESIEDDIFAGVFSVKSVVEDAVAKSITLLTEKKTESTPQNKANIEKNGSGESKDDCLPKNALEIHIDPKNSVGDDDIFADVFPSPQSAKLSQSDPSKVQNLPKSLEIVIDPNASPEEDIFAEVFANPQPAKPTTSTVSPESQIVTPALPEPLEIVIDPNESPDEDIFADVFSQPADSVTTPTGSRSNVKEIDASQNTMNDSDDCGKSAESVEITVDPDAAPDDDLFADVSIETTHTNLPTIKPSFRKLVNDIKKSSSTRDLSDIKNILEKESQQLAGETKREERLASTITEQITQEAQNLLELFGIPYLIAPMEAEAQCAYLDLTGQTEGTITDDSDIWLFGANNVYKNFFDQKKFVRLFKSSDIHQCYRLNRDDMIMIAMLVGSDYTSGLAGVGPVNAIEIVAHFPRSQGAATPQSRLLKFVDAYLSSEMNPQLFKKLKSVEFTDGFPSDEVVKAYLSPIVDESKEKFSWSKPDLGKIKNFMRDKFGWDFNRTDKTLIPIFDKLNQSNTQKTIHNYFDWAFDLNEAATVSKRVGNAVEILTTGIIPSPSKKLRNDDATSNRSEPKDRMVSNYSRRKYGRYQQQEKELEKEPVLEGMRAARAAAKAIMTATRKPAAKSADVGGESSCSELPIGPSTSRGRGRPKKDVQDAKESSSSDRTTPKKRKPPADPDPVPSSSSCAPLPALSDILCGVGSEPSLPEVPSLWTPSRDLVSPYTKRKYGKVGQSTAPKRDPSNFAVPERPKQSFDHVMRSKTPAQIARERAAKKLKEAKQKAAQNKTKK
uniref:XPG-I domain-containing protein n=1 Tax=Lygus hesperus TaxID=30085 RepID=A0A0A9WAL1_LYGHE